ncbi:hypothetical protein JCM19294_2494 [Nonlabens tegetincola]|uniref:Uncharacterized protein n=2 Tax=Nonlabens tegetincola TaxID=323273 RepID=A0A090Q0K1_9FLAO|nr:MULTISPECIES: hypothetical protein [Nonlabens]MEE2800679.1 hypothetical protein [Bacteroidota bacterium]GAK95712.1 hypothetical protein JCM19294_2494 [Nonlabens tegetincola]
MKKNKLFYFVLLAIILMACTNNSEQIKDDSEKGTIPSEVEKYAVPKSSVSWNSDKFNKLSIDDLFDVYKAEKNEHRSELYYNNLLAMWHTNFYSRTSQLNEEQVNVLINDMSRMNSNIPSMATFYSLVNKNYKLSDPKRKKLLDDFYNKNKMYLENASWNNQELQKQKLGQLNKLQFLN